MFSKYWTKLILASLAVSVLTACPNRSRRSDDGGSRSRYTGIWVDAEVARDLRRHQVADGPRWSFVPEKRNEFCQCLRERKRVHRIVANRERFRQANIDAIVVRNNGEVYNYSLESAPTRRFGAVDANGFYHYGDGKEKPTGSQEYFMDDDMDTQLISSNARFHLEPNSDLLTVHVGPRTKKYVQFNPNAGADEELISYRTYTDECISKWGRPTRRDLVEIGRDDATGRRFYDENGGEMGAQDDQDGLDPDGLEGPEGRRNRQSKKERPNLAGNGGLTVPQEEGDFD